MTTRGSLRCRKTRDSASVLSDVCATSPCHWSLRWSMVALGGDPGPAVSPTEPPCASDAWTARWRVGYFPCTSGDPRTATR
jgi:hypothetical protein